MIQPVKNRHTAQTKKSDQDSQAGDLDVSDENINDNESDKEESKPVDDEETSADNVNGSDTFVGRLQDKDLDGDNMLNSETANTCEKEKRNSNSLHKAQDSVKLAADLKWINEHEKLPLNFLIDRHSYYNAPEEIRKF